MSLMSGTSGTYIFGSLVVKILSSSLALTLLTSAAKTHCLVHLSSNSTLQLINDISSDLQKILRYFNGTAIVSFFRIPPSVA